MAASKIFGEGVAMQLQSAWQAVQRCSGQNEDEHEDEDKDENADKNDDEDENQNEDENGDVRF